MAFFIWVAPSLKARGSKAIGNHAHEVHTDLLWSCIHHENRHIIFHALFFLVLLSQTPKPILSFSLPTSGPFIFFLFTLDPWYSSLLVPPSPCSPPSCLTQLLFRIPLDYSGPIWIYCSPISICCQPIHWSSFKSDSLVHNCCTTWS